MTLYEGQSESETKINSYADYEKVCTDIVSQTENTTFTEDHALKLLEARHQLLTGVKKGTIEAGFYTSPVKDWGENLLTDIKTTLDGKGWNDTSINSLYYAAQGGGAFRDTDPAIKFIRGLSTKNK